RNATRPAVVWNGRTFTFEEIKRRSSHYVDRLRAFGVQPGDRVAVFAETCPEIVAALVGHLGAGIIHVPINTRYRAEEARHILEDSGAAAVLTRRTDECAGVLDQILADGRPATLLHVLHLDEVFPFLPFEASLSSFSSSVDARGDPPAGDDVALLIYTSGTTGKSKGVALSYRALEENTRSMMELWRFSPADRLVLALPLFHVHGLCLGVAGALLTGFTLLLEARFDAARVVEAFANEDATAFMGVPTMYVRLLEHLDAHPEGAEALRKARLFTAGSAPLPAADFAAFREKTGHAILERYGMTETLFTLSNPYEGERRPGTVGLPVPGCSVRLVDDEGRDAPEGEPGEILVKGNGLMSGYWGREADTAAAFRDGWFLTGDVARRDADGYVTLLGRKSVDVIKSGGYKISAREIEDVLRRHPAVKDAAVVGLPDRLWGQRIAAAVVLVEPRDADAAKRACEEIAAFAASCLADFKKPRDLRAVTALPRNALGKVQKHLLVKSLGEGFP
ncbi:MAG TPA: acyl-CoA synthetase, partial [Thermoanaerobaculia bacterium]|nr:acyl-CoA synthetase [Thermoanaerobaculia bacterium]